MLVIEHLPRNKAKEVVNYWKATQMAMAEEGVRRVGHMLIDYLYNKGYEIVKEVEDGRSGNH